MMKYIILFFFFTITIALVARWWKNGRKLPSLSWPWPKKEEPKKEEHEKKAEAKHDDHGHSSHGGGWRFPSFTFGNVFWAIVFVGVLLLVLSPSLRELTVSKIAYAVEGPPPASSYADKRCRGVELPLYLTSGEWTKLNPGHRCRIVYYKDRGEIVVDESENFARAREGIIRGTYSLCPIYTSEPQNFDCSPL